MAQERPLVVNGGKCMGLKDAVFIIPAGILNTANQFNCIKTLRHSIFSQSL